MALASQEWEKRILLLSCYEFYENQLQKLGYQVETGYLFAPLSGHIRIRLPGDTRWNKGPGHDCPKGHDYPKVPPEFSTIVYDPYLPVVVEDRESQFSVEVIRDKCDVFSDLAKTVEKAGTIVVVFVNPLHMEYLSQWIETKFRHLVPIIEKKKHNKNIHPRDLFLGEAQQDSYPHEVYGEFWSPLTIRYENNSMTDFASNPVAETLRGVLEPFLEVQEYSWPVLVPSNSYAVKGESPEQATPVLVNPAGEAHALWVCKGKGGILFLPRFQNNFDVLKALLQMPITKLLDIEVESEKDPPPQAPKDPQTAEEWIIWLHQQFIENNEKRKAAGMPPLQFQGSRKIATFLGTKGIEISHTTVIDKIKILQEQDLLDYHWDITDTPANKGSTMLDSANSEGEIPRNPLSAGQRAKNKPDKETDG